MARIVLGSNEMFLSRICIYQLLLFPPPSKICVWNPELLSILHFSLFWCGYSALFSSWHNCIWFHFELFSGMMTGLQSSQMLYPYPRTIQPIASCYANYTIMETPKCVHNSVKGIQYCMMIKIFKYGILFFYIICVNCYMQYVVMTREFNV
jgi:hypothetical protein